MTFSEPLFDPLHAGAALTVPRSIRQVECQALETSEVGEEGRIWIPVNKDSQRHARESHEAHQDLMRSTQIRLRTIRSGRPQIETHCHSCVGTAGCSALVNY